MNPTHQPPSEAQRHALGSMLLRAVLVTLKPDPLLDGLWGDLGQVFDKCIQLYDKVRSQALDIQDVQLIALLEARAALESLEHLCHVRVTHCTSQEGSTRTIYALVEKPK